MTGCPSHEELARLLATGGHPDLEATEAHVGECRACQDSLTELSGGSEWWLQARSTLADTLAVVSAEAVEVFRKIPLAVPAEARPTIPGYELADVLGRGGMGVVYAATQVRLGRTVAVKVLGGGRFVDPGARRRFLAEAAAVARLQHPNVVAVYDSGEAGGCAYLTMEYVPGGSLAQALKARPYSVADAAGLVEAVARGVHHSHEHGVVHRDLKPGNILLAAGGPKVADFGLAADIGAEAVTGTGELLGTPQYMAPEQAAGRRAEVGPRTDVFALGAILYELLTGQSPFAAATAVDTLVRVSFQDPVPPRRLNRRVPKPLENVCLKCLEKSSRRRYGSALELADDLARFREGKPVAARPLSRLGRVRNWAARNPTAAGLLVALVAAVASGLVAVSLSLIEARTAQQSEAAERRAADDARDAARAALARSQRSVYFGTIAQARSQWLLSNAPGATRLLAGCEPDARGWEWRYLTACANADLRTVSEPDAPYVNAVAFDPSGKRAFAAGGSPFATGERGRVWAVDAETGRTLWRAGAAETVWAVAVDRAGGTVATLGGNPRMPSPNELRLWDAATGAPRGAFPGHAAAPGAVVAFAADGALARVISHREVAVMGPDRRERWRAEHDIARGVSFTPDGRHVVTSGGDGVRVWDAAAGTLVRSLPQMGTHHALDPSGTRIATATASAVKVWDVGDLGPPGRPPALLHSHALDGAGPHGLAFAPDGESLAAAIPDGTVRVWATADGMERAVYRGHTGRAAAVAFRPDARVLLSASQQPGELKFWDCTAAVETETPLAFDLDQRDVEAIAFTDDGRQLRAVANGGRFRAWDYGLNRPVPDEGYWFTADWLVPAAPAAFSGDGRRVAGVALEDRKVVRLVDADRHRRLRDLRGHSLPVWHVALDRTGARLASVGIGTKDGRRVRERIVWDAASGAELHRDTAPDEITRSLAWSPDGRRLAEALRRTTGAGGRVLLLDPADPNQPVTCGPFDSPSCLAVSDDGWTLAVLDDAGTLSLWDAVTGAAKRAPTAADEQVCMIRFDPTGTRIAGVSRERVFLWDVETGHELLDLPAGPRRPSDNGFNPQVAWSPDGSRLAVSTWNRTVNVFGTSRRADPAGRAAAWHRVRAVECDTRESAAAVRFHREQLDAIVPTDPEVSALRGHYYAHRGEWERARAEYARGFTDGFPARVERWPPYAVLLLKTGDVPTYSRLRAESLRRANEVESPEVRLDVLRVAGLRGDLGPDGPRLVELADRVRGDLPDRAHALAWVALAYYRAGQPDRARELVGPLLREAPVVAAVFGLIGEGAAVGPARSRATEWAANEEKFLEPFRGHGVSWDLKNWLSVRMLLAEVQAR